ncbi:hypothetical protein HN51_020341 [Arachis hypogaea]|uniref:FCS-Like Zinc finger 10 n=2 Tax=Arachis TaxID=3817 RepID=A0A6P4B718_ARADU|nr:FCS-Like Zinc finger 10 [Arachis duranensis]XP_025615563.1 FCS-Like Zinc finger 10 [Arachis hypogaea]XP_052108487.1 FCS-Like Zinc finger 10 [Arachis duranensis]QHO32275.1 uncharacterized protein DS421_8g248450 [Arachis hypogaea]RYR44453.1 hypothetical protein Ahy_A08g040778 [Arachis hypogaea]
MLRKRSRSQQKDQNQMDSNSDHYSPQFLALGQNKTQQNHSIFNNVPCLFVGFGPKGLLDADSVRSPTSPLDSRVLSNLGNHVVNIRTPKSSCNQRSWDCCKVGLSLIDSLEDCPKFNGKILRCSESKNISVTPKASNCEKAYLDYNFDSTSSKSLPKDFCKAPPPFTTQKIGSILQKGGSESSVLFEIGDSGLDHEIFGKTRSCSLDSCSPLKTLYSDLVNSSNTDPNKDDFALKDVVVMNTTTQLSSPPHFIGGSKNYSKNTLSMCSCSNEFIKSLSANEIENSEDYTCVISRGPNPKTTHIFCDCILETHHDNNDEFKNHLKIEEMEKEKGVVSLLQTPIHYPSSEFLSFCHHCKKKLEEGKDIYMYRGERAFCSLTCRALEIMNDEELEEESDNTPSSRNSPNQEHGEKLFETGIITSNR